jgi:hypothetical protein
MQRTALRSLTAVVVVVAAYGCHAAPRGRAVELGPVDTGAGSVEATRRHLRGTWELVTLDVYPADARPVTVQATGRLVYDEFGNLSMRGTVAGGPAIDASVLNLTGRVVIDPDTHSLRFESITARTADEKRLDPQFDTRHVRYYEFVGDLLKMTTRGADGSVLAVATWRRVS